MAAGFHAIHGRDIALYESDEGKNTMAESRGDWDCVFSSYPLRAGDVFSVKVDQYPRENALKLGITELSPHEMRRKGFPRDRFWGMKTLSTGDAILEDRRYMKRTYPSIAWQTGACVRENYRHFNGFTVAYSHQTSVDDTYTVRMCADRSVSIQYNNRTAHNVFTELKDKPYWVVFWIPKATRIEALKTDADHSLRGSCRRVILCHVHYRSLRHLPLPKVLINYLLCK